MNRNALPKFIVLEPTYEHHAFCDSSIEELIKAQANKTQTVCPKGVPLLLLNIQTVQVEVVQGKQTVMDAQCYTLVLPNGNMAFLEVDEELESHIKDWVDE